MSRYIIDKNKLIENINIIKEKAKFLNFPGAEIYESS